jgi:hypothetical protein
MEDEANVDMNAALIRQAAVHVLIHLAMLIVLRVNRF